MPDLKPVTVWHMGVSPNPWKVVIVLEELGIPWVFSEPVNFVTVKQEPYISLNPNGRVPAIEDPNKNIVLWESGAIIDYLIDVYDTKATLQYTTFPEKHLTRCWEHFQMSGQGPYTGQKGWFSYYHPEKIDSVIERYRNEIKRIIGVIDGHLAKQGTQYLVGDRVTYADLMFVPYAHALGIIFAPEIDTTEWKHYTAWTERLFARPSVVKAFKLWADERAKPAVQQQLEDWDKEKKEKEAKA